MPAPVLYTAPPNEYLIRQPRLARLTNQELLTVFYAHVLELARFRARGALDNRRWSHNACIREQLQEVNVHGKADRHMRLLTIETRRKAGWAHSGIKKGVINFARRKSCRKQREMKK